MQMNFEPVLAFIKDIVDRYGCKQLIAGGAVYSIARMVDKGQLEGLYGSVAIVVTCVAFFIFRNYEHLQNIRKEQNENKTDDTVVADLASLDRASTSAGN